MRYYPQFSQNIEWTLDRHEEQQPFRSITPNYKYSGEVDSSLPEKNKKEKSHNQVFKTHQKQEEIHKQIESIRNRTNAHIAAVKDRTNFQIEAARNKTISQIAAAINKKKDHIDAVRNITNSQIAAIRDTTKAKIEAVRNTTKIKIDAARNRTNAHLDAKKNYLQNIANKVSQIQVHVEAGIKHGSGNHGVALDVSSNGVNIETGPVINENSQRRSDTFTTLADSNFQSTESEKGILATISPETTAAVEKKAQYQTASKLEESQEGLRTWNILSPVFGEGVKEESKTEVIRETSTLASGFHTLNISKPSAVNDYEVHETIEEGNNYIFRDSFTTEKALMVEEISTEGEVKNNIELDSLPEVATEEIGNGHDDVRNVPEESENKTVASMINDEMSEADVESKFNFDSKKEISSTEFMEKLLEKLYTTPADDYASIVWEPEKINHDDTLKSVVEKEVDLKSETTELPVEIREMEDGKLEELVTTESEKYLRDYAEDKNDETMEQHAYTTEYFRSELEPTESLYKETLMDEQRYINEPTTNFPELKMIEETSEAFRNEEVTVIVDEQARNAEGTTAVMYDETETEQDPKRERKLHHQQQLDSNDIGDQYFMITEAESFTEKSFSDINSPAYLEEHPSTEHPPSSNDETNHIFYFNQDGKNLTSLSQIKSESSTEKRRSDILITDEYNELPDAHEDESSSFTNLTIFTLNPNDNETDTTYQEPPDTFSPESLLQLIPVIIHELRANKSVTPEDMKVFSDLYGKLWPAIEQISKNPEINVTQLLNIKNEEDLKNLMNLFAKLQEMEEDKNEDLESAETSSQAFSTIRYEEPNLYDYVDDHQEESYEPPEEIIDEKEEELEHEKEMSEFNARNMDTEDFSTGGFQDSYNDYVAEESLPESFSEPQIDYDL